MLSLLAPSAACPFAAKASSADLRRATATSPRDAFTASSAAAIRTKLNKHLLAGPLALPRPQACEDFDLPALHAASRSLHCHAADELLSAYKQGDLRATHHDDAAALEAELASEAEYAGAHPEVVAAVRDARCHTLAMQWTHHLTSEGRKAVAAANVSLPLLPSKGAAEHVPSLEAAGHGGVARAVEAAVTCQIGHEAKKVARGQWEGFPHWPYEVTYNASGYGPYPFWTLGGGTGGSLSGKGTPIQTWWSAVLNAERLDHGSCNMAGVGHKDGVPCTHLFVDGAYAYLYSQDQAFCCVSSEPASEDKCHLTRPQRDFMDVFSYKGEIDYTSEDGLYTGKAKHYSMHLTNPSDFWFWYVTKPDGTPLEQGEGPCDMYDSETGSRECEGPPKMLFHQYHPGTFQNVTLDPAVFDVPAKCLEKGTKTCVVEPQGFCGSSARAALVEQAA